MIKKGNHYIILLFIFFPFFGFTQIKPVIKEISRDPYTKFHRISLEDGLCSETVLDIFQDSKNYIWFCTTNGLNKYDGMRMKSYRYNRDDSLSIPAGAVTCVDEDDNGNFWVGTEGGLCKYSRTYDRFIKVKLDTFSSAESNHIRAILAEGDSILWIQTINGWFFKYGIQISKVLKTYITRHNWQKYYYYQDIYRDNDGILWIGGRGTNPMYLDEQTDKIIKIPCANKPGVPGMKREEDVGCYFHDSKGNFWVTGLDGVYQMDKKTQYFTKMLHVSSYSIIQPEENKLWIASGYGIFIYDLENSTAIQHIYQKNNNNSLPANHINKLYEDNNGTIWIATNNGVAYYRKEEQRVKHIFHIPENENTPSSNLVTALIQSNDSTLWIGHAFEGLDKFNLGTKSIRRFQPEFASKTTIPSGKIKNLYKDKFGDLYIALWAGIGFCKLDADIDKFSLYTYDQNSLAKDWYNDFAEDSLGNFYIGFWGNQGLMKFDRNAGKFKESLKDKFNDAFESRLISKLLYDTKNRLWMGTTSRGVHIYYPAKDTSKHFYNQTDLKTSFFDKVIHDIFEDKDGTIWIAADSLYRFNEREQNFTVWGKDKGLPCSYVFKILQDNDGLFWLGTARGIISFNPKTGLSRTYTSLSGYKQDAEYHAAVKLNDGRMVFGSSNGIVIFNPDEIKKANILPDLFFTELQVKGEPRIPDLTTIDIIELDYDENYFSIYFAVSDVSASNNFMFRYKLEGFDEKWNTIEEGIPVAKYTNVPHGSYKFVVQATNIGTDWETLKMREITIVIHPPFWLRPWFLIFVILIVLVGITWFMVNRTMRLRLRVRNAELKQSLLRVQMNPHFIFNSLIAIQSFIYEQKEKDAGRYLSDFSKLIRLILDNSMKEFISLEKEIHTIEYYLKLQQLRFDNKFDYIINLDPSIETEFVGIPPMLSQPHIENAIEHGISLKEERGIIKIDIRQKKNTIVIEIEDDGVGRKRALEIQKGNRKDHRSYGMKITRERIQVLKRKYGMNIHFEVYDLKNDAGDAAGTRVEFEIPFRNL